MRRRLAIEAGSWRCGLIRGAAQPEVGRRAEALAAIVRARVASATDGAAQNMPAKLFGFMRSPTSALSHLKSRI